MGSGSCGQGILWAGVLSAVATKDLIKDFLIVPSYYLNLCMAICSPSKTTISHVA